MTGGSASEGEPSGTKSKSNKPVGRPACSIRDQTPAWLFMKTANNYAKHYSPGPDRMEKILKTKLPKQVFFGLGVERMDLRRKSFQVQFQLLIFSPGILHISILFGLKCITIGTEDQRMVLSVPFFSSPIYPALVSRADGFDFLSQLI